jgi:hypothetical protein
MKLKWLNKKQIEKKNYTQFLNNFILNDKKIKKREDWVII